MTPLDYLIGSSLYAWPLYLIAILVLAVVVFVLRGQR
jgi:hypothetical protein